MTKRILGIVAFIIFFLFVNNVIFSRDIVIITNNYYVNPQEEIEVVEEQDDKPKLDLININKLRKDKGNDDIVGVVKIDSINLNAIVVKGKDNDYYLKHDLAKKNSIFGTEFVDARNNNDLAHEKQINIYGHNSRIEDYTSKLEFSKLNKITDKNVFNNLSDIYFYIDNDVLVYKPVIVKVITTDYEYTRLVYKSKEVLKKHLDNLSSKTMYCNGDCQIAEDKDIIILQTCYYDPVGSYLLLIGIK